MSGHPDKRIPDEAIMGRVRDGHRASLRMLVERYWSPLVGYAAGIVGGRDDAKDVVQDVFIQVWKKRRSWQPRGSVGAYLYRIARNLSLNARRDRRTRKRNDERGGVALARESPPRTPDETLEVASLRADMQEAIDDLPERRREVFVLSRFHGLTHREIADALEVSHQTVSNQMTTALADLRKALAHRLQEEC